MFDCYKFPHSLLLVVYMEGILDTRIISTSAAVSSPLIIYCCAMQDVPLTDALQSARLCRSCTRSLLVSDVCGAGGRSVSIDANSVCVCP